MRFLCLKPVIIPWEPSGDRQPVSIVNGYDANMDVTAIATGDANSLM